MNKPLFSLGQVVATPPCLVALKKAGQAPDVFLNRHVIGDWGNIDEHDAQVNEDALWGDSRIMSVYKTNCGEVICLITEADRNSTTLLLPSDY